MFVLPAIALAGFGVVAVPQIAQAGSNLCVAYVDANGGGTCRNLIAQREDPYVGSTANDGLTSWATNGAC